MHMGYLIRDNSYIDLTSVQEKPQYVTNQNGFVEPYLYDKFHSQLPVAYECSEIDK